MPEFKIEERFVDVFKAKVKKLMALCKKYNLDYTFEDLGSSIEWCRDKYIKYHKYLIEDPVDNTGWRLLARIDHTESGNIVMNISSEDIPRHYYYDPGKCDHCHTNRNRKHTYIIKSEDGEYKQVGIKCSEDYICENFFEWTAYWCSCLSVFKKMEEDSFSEEGVKSAEEYYEVRDIIAHSIDAINKYGYNKEDGSTKYQVLTSINKGKKIDSSCFDLADRIIGWIFSLDESESDYIHNIQVCFNNGYVKSNEVPLIISSYPYFRGYMARMESCRLSSHKYNVGDKVTIKTNDFKQVTALDSIYGIVYIYRFTDSEHNVYTWKTGKYIGGNITSVTGTVKACKEYKGEKQTELTRCKVKDIN